jgi:spermidine synthase
MRDRHTDTRISGFLALLGALFLASGATGLIYEVIWFRLLFLKLGGTGLSVATVTAAFMLGLGLGAWAFGARLALRVPPVRLYAFLEAAIGLYALLVPVLVTAVGHLDALLLGGEAAGTGARFVRFLLAGAVLLPPTICMGGTLPALSRLVEVEPHRPGRFVGGLYGLNTAGAVVGAGSAGFLLLPYLGFSRTVLLAAALNLALAGIAYLLSLLHAPWREPLQTPRAAPSRRPAVPEEASPAAGRPRLAVLAYTASGAVAFMLQVAWARILTMVFASTVYAFSFILVVFLSGLGIGALVAAPALDRRVSPARGLAWTFVVVGAVALLGQGLYDRLPALYLAALMTSESGHALVWAALLAALLMIPATLALGAGFPLAVRLATGDDRPNTSARVGYLYAGNTAGSVVGAFSTALVLIPILGLIGVVTLAALLASAVGLLLALSREAGARPGTAWKPAWGPMATAAAAIGIWLAVVPAWNRSLMTESVAFWRSYAVMKGDEVWKKLEGHRTGDLARLLYYRDGVTATVAVKEERSGSGIVNRYLTIDGKVDASSVPDMLQQTFLAHLPLMAIDPQAADVLVIGYASGVTTGSVLTHPVGTVVVAEIEEAVMEASHFFDDVNNRPLDDPRLEVVTDDARAYLERTDRRFDVVSSSPSSAWLSGPAKLFTLESMALIRSHLKEGGLLCQYVQAYDLNEAAVLTLLRTVQEVFSHVAVFQARSGNLLVLASEHPIGFRVTDLARHWSRPEVRADLARIGVQGPCGLLDRAVAEPEAVAAVVGAGPLNTDDNALLEYRGPQTAGLSVHEQVLARLRKYSRGPATLLGDLQPGGPIDPRPLAATCLQQQAYRLAASLARQRLALGPDPDSLWVLAEAERQENQRLQALEHLDEALQLWPDHPLSLIARALTLQDLGRQADAIEGWNRAAAVVGPIPLIRHHRGRLLLQTGDIDGAVAELSTALRAPAEQALEAPAEVYLARALEEAGRPAEARAYLEAYLHRRAADDTLAAAAVAARERLARLLMQAGGDEERATVLASEAREHRQRLAAAVVDDAGNRLEAEGETSARAYLDELCSLDPLLAPALAAEVAGRHERGQDVSADLVRLVQQLR